MIAARTFAHADVAVFGLARTGMGAVKALRAGRAKVYAWDDNEEQRKLAAAEGATILNWPEWPWDKLKSVVLSPGIPLTHPKPHAVVDQAKYAGVEVIGDMEVFARELGADPAIPGRAP